MRHYSHNFSRGRRGSVYVIVLGLSMLVTVVGFSALAAARIGARTNTQTNDYLAARTLSNSGVEYALTLINSDPTWRTRYANAVSTTPVSFGGGSISFALADPLDNNLANNTIDPVQITVTATFRKAKAISQATLTPKLTGLSCLDVAMIANTTITFNSATVQNGQTIAANNYVMGNSSQVNGRIEALNWINGGVFSGTKVTGVAPRSMPDATAFDYYKQIRTPIPISSIPILSGTRCIRDTVLSPQRNPYGATQPQGIYCIDCQSQTLTIDNVRIVGTLVLINASNVTVQNSINWEPAVSNLPALMVQGKLTLDVANSQLSENGLNFNPPGTPYQGVEDSDTVDNYPSTIKGLIYCSGALTTTDHPSVTGLVIADSIITSSAFDLAYAATYKQNPPPGFSRAAYMMVLPGSWK